MEEDKGFRISQNIKPPSQTDSFATKQSRAYGKAVADMIYSEWFYKGTAGNCRFYTGRNQFLERRIYANGLVDMSKYYPMLGTNGDVSLLNLSKKPLSRMPKIVDLVVNGMVNRPYSIKAKAIDPSSEEEKRAYRKKIEDEKNALPFVKKALAETGIDVGAIPEDEIPQSKEEMDIHMQMEWKPSNCLSNQIAIATVMEENEYNLVLDKKVKRSLVVDGAAATRTRLNPSKGMVIEHIDFADMVYSPTKDPYFNDCFYKGHVAQVLLSDIFVEYPELLNTENTDVKKDIEISASNWAKIHGLNSDSALKGHTNLLYFTYKTFRERAKKVKKLSNGETVIEDANEFFDASKPKDKKDRYIRNSIVEEVLFEGCMVLGTNILLKWGLAKSMTRPKSNNKKVCEQYRMIAPNMESGHIASLVSRMMPVEDDLNIIELKAQQIRQGITPDGIAIDIDALADIDMGDGKTQTVQQSLNMYLQKGSYMYRSSQIGGEYNNAQKPFQEIQTGDSINKLVALRNESNAKLIELTDLVGLNKASDASTPDKDSLVGIQKIAAYNSNLATRHILDGAGYLVLKTAETISYAISDILKYYPSLREDLIQKIGASAVADLDIVRDLHLSDFAIFYELEMDDEERAELNQDLSISVEKGYLGLEDKYKIRNIKILDLAIQYLTVLVKKRAKIMQEQEAQKFKIQSDENIRAAQEAEKARQETAQLEGQIKAQVQQAISQGEIAKEQARGEQDRMTLAQKQEGDIQVQLLVNSGATQKLEKMQSDKEKNLATQATATSRIADQKAKDKDPIDFEGEKAEMEIFNQ
jgi:hypothetical protein